MSMDREQFMAEQLSRCIDKMNSSQDYQVNERQTAELLAVAELVKKTAPVVAVPDAMVQQTIDILAGELKAQHTNKRRKWLYSGSIGTAAAVLLVTTLQLYNFTPKQPETYQPQLEGTVIIEKVAQVPSQTEQQIAQTETAVPPTDVMKIANSETDKVTKPAAQADVSHSQAAPAKPITEQKSAAITSADVQSKQAPRAAMARMESSTTDSVALKKAQPDHPKEAMVALAGRQARSVEVDKASGTIRQVYDMDQAGEVTVIQKNTSPAAAAAEKPSVMSRSVAQADEETKLNKVTVTVDGKEVTVEGKMPKEELLKLAENLVSE